MAGPFGIPFQVSAIDGVPVFWADAPGRGAAGLLFRVGRADESLAGAGVTHLVQELALRALGPQHTEPTGRVDGTITSFYLHGSDDELVAGIWDLTRALRGLHGGQLDVLKRVLSTGERNADAQPLALRYGAAGHGLAFHEEYGLRWLREEHVRRWAEERFTRHNAALWITRPPPPGLRLQLGDGSRIPPPEPAPRARLDLPAFAAGATSGLTVTFEADAGAAIDMAMSAIADRAHAQLGHVHAWSLPLTGTRVHKEVGVEGESAETLDLLLTMVDDVAASGPAEAELRDARDAALHALSVDAAVPGGLDALAAGELLGAPRRFKEDQAAAIDVVSAADAAAALRDAVRTQLVLAPATVSKPDRPMLGDYPWWNPPPVSGRDLLPYTARTRLGGRRASARLIAGSDGVSHAGIEPWLVSTVRFADLVAAVQEPNGSLTLIGRDGATIAIDVESYPEARALVADLERTVPPELLVPPREMLAGGGHDVDALAKRKLARMWAMQTELRLLRQRLHDGEAVINMSEAAIAFKVGLLVLTDRRIVWVYRGIAGNPEHKELPYTDVRSVKLSGRGGRTLTLRSPIGETAFSDLNPRERGPELVEEIQRRAAGVGSAA